jgi:hypothetical protein
MDTYLIHQTGDKNKAIGSASRYMDFDRWNGSKADVCATSATLNMSIPTRLRRTPAQFSSARAAWFQPLQT